jgi:hypothetical protein
LRIEDVALRPEDEPGQHLHPSGDLDHVKGVEQGSDVGEASSAGQEAVEEVQTEARGGRPKKPINRHLEEELEVERAKNDRLVYLLERVRDDINGTLEEMARYQRGRKRK